MKKLVKLFLFVFGLHTMVSGQQSTTTYQQKNLKGQVKALKEFTISPIPPMLIRGEQTIDTLTSGFFEFDKNNRMVSNQVYVRGHHQYTNHYFYSKNGQLVKIISYNPDAFHSKQLNKYNQQQLLIENIVYDSKNQEINKTTYQYNASGKVTELKYYIEKKLESTVLYTYDEPTKSVEIKTYHPGGSISYWEKKQYDSAGNYLEWIKFDTQGKLMARYAYTYAITDKGKETKLISYSETNEVRDITIFKTDQNGDPIETITYRSDGSIASTIRYQYTYDTYGNWIFQNISGANETSHSIIREITY